MQFFPTTAYCHKPLLSNHHVVYVSEKQMEFARKGMFVPFFPQDSSSLRWQTVWRSKGGTAG